MTVFIFHALRSLSTFATGALLTLAFDGEWSRLASSSLIAAATVGTFFYYTRQRKRGQSWATAAAVQRTSGPSSESRSR